MASSSNFPSFSEDFYISLFSEELADLPLLKEDDFRITTAALKALSQGKEFSQDLSAKIAARPELAKRIKVLKEDYLEAEIAAPGSADKFRELFSKVVLEKAHELENMSPNQKTAYMQTHSQEKTTDRGNESPFSEGRYLDFFNDQFKNLPTFDRTDFPVITSALRSIANEKPFTSLTKDELQNRPELAKRLFELKKDYQHPELWVPPNQEGQFLSLFKKNLLEKADKLETMSSSDIDYTIENYINDKQTARENQEKQKKAELPLPGSDKRTRPTYSERDTIETVQDFLTQNYETNEWRDYIYSVSDLNLLQDMIDQLRSKLPPNVHDILRDCYTETLQRMSDFLINQATKEEIQIFVQNYRLSCTNRILTNFNPHAKYGSLYRENLGFLFEAYVANSPPIKDVMYFTSLRTAHFPISLSKEAMQTIHNYLLTQNKNDVDTLQFFKFYIHHKFPQEMLSELLLMKEAKQIINGCLFTRGYNDAQWHQFFRSLSSTSQVESIKDILFSDFSPEMQNDLENNSSRLYTNSLEKLLFDDNIDIKKPFQNSSKRYCEKILDLLLTYSTDESQRNWLDLNDKDTLERIGFMIEGYLSKSPNLSYIEHLMTMLPMQLAPSTKQTLHNYLLTQEMDEIRLEKFLLIYKRHDFSQTMIDELTQKAENR